MTLKRAAGIAGRATLLAAVIMAAAAPSRVSAADNRVGPYFEASLLCNPYDDKLTVQARAGAAPGRSSQWIYYKHSLWRDGTGFIDLNPPAQGWLLHEPQNVQFWNPFGGGTVLGAADTPGLEWTISVGSGSYAIWTDYAWEQPDGTFVWYGAWSNWTTYAYRHTAAQTPWCNVDLNVLDLPN